VTILFYAAEPAERPLDRPPLDADVRLWCPHTDGLPRRCPRYATNLCWWAADRLGAFASHDFTELSLWRGDRMLHRLVVTPRWYRFPFMAPDELQIGALWTDPSERGRGLARAAIMEAHRLAAHATRLWYLVDAGNLPSIALIESCGYRCIGTGRRTRPLGLTPAGRFRLDQTRT
jgi:RimJ/RimL family protein N-acetyltransferase